MRGTTATRTKPNKDKKRSAKRKARRQEHAKQVGKLQAAYKSRRADLNIIMVRGEDEVVLGVRRGLFGHCRAPILRMTHEEIVGAVEDSKELGSLVTKLGVLALSQLLGYNLAYGTEDMGKAFAKWAKVDLEALKKAEEDEISETVQASREAEDKIPESGGGLSGISPDQEAE